MLSHVTRMAYSQYRRALGGKPAAQYSLLVKPRGRVREVEHGLGPGSARILYHKLG